MLKNTLDEMTETVASNGRLIVNHVKFIKEKYFRFNNNDKNNKQYYIPKQEYSNYILITISYHKD